MASPVRILLMYLRHIDAQRVRRARELLREKGYDPGLARVEAHYLACARGLAPFEEFVEQVALIDRVQSESDFAALCAAHLGGWLRAVRSIEDLRDPERVRELEKRAPRRPPAMAAPAWWWVATGIALALAIGVICDRVAARRRDERVKEQAQSRPAQVPSPPATAR